MTDPNFDPSLFVVAWDGEEIAGAVLNLIDADENAALGRQRGLLDSVFVRRPWRRRGLAAALVGRSLALLRERGMTSAWLGVDADNPMGALGVYQRAGFTVHERSTAYHKPMDPAP
jgi:ribosomal protein S18 acetylase RimI-like enzyme